MHYQDIFNDLWAQYSQINPQADEIHELLTKEGETVENDHVAFRTFNDPRVNIEVFAQPFLECGYEEKGEYHFEVKKLFAKHYEHKLDKHAPKVFISELKTECFSESLQTIVKNCVDEAVRNKLDPYHLIQAACLWPEPSYQTYQALLKESEYAAWLYAYGFRANHFTVNVNALKKFEEVSILNDWLIKKGFDLNISGGLIKGSKSDLLEQSSTMASIVKKKFKEGVYEVPGCYYEFAKRYKDDNGILYTGFVAASADKIFESTDVKS